MTISNSSALSALSSSSSGSSTLAATQSLAINFVIAEPLLSIVPGTNLSACSQIPALEFTVSSSNETRSGYALPE